MITGAETVSKPENKNRQEKNVCILGVMFPPQVLIYSHLKFKKHQKYENITTDSGC